MTNFGEGHYLYFCFLKNMAFLFGFLALMPGLINIAINVSGGWYASGDFQLTTIGSFGPLSHAGSQSTMKWGLNGGLPSDGRSTQRGGTGRVFILKLLMVTNNRNMALHNCFLRLAAPCPAFFKIHNLKRSPNRSHFTFFMVERVQS
jgi:hypothetical protein